MTVKDGIVFGIGFTIGKILITDLVNIGGCSYASNDEKSKL